MADFVYGKNTVIELLKSNHKILNIMVLEPVLSKDQTLKSLIEKNKIPYELVNRKELDKLVSGNHQGIVAKIESFEYFELDDLLAEAKRRNENPFLVILDGLEDPHNLGAILRTADACGVHGIIIPKNRSVGLTPTVAKLSTGAIEYVKVSRVTNISQTIKELKKQGLWIIGTDGEALMDYRQMDATVPCAVVIGSEGKGISRLVKENCDLLVKLPMKGHVSSLNASVATSIILYEVFNKRCPL